MQRSTERHRDVEWAVPHLYEMDVIWEGYLEQGIPDPDQTNQPRGPVLRG